MSPITSASLRIDHGVGLGRLHDGAVAGGERRRDLPRGHQQREVERDDLPDHAERLGEVVGDRVLVDLRDACPPRRGSRRRSSGSGRRPAGCRRRASRAPACRSPSSRRPRASRGSPRSRRRRRSAPSSVRSCEASPQASLAACAASSASSMSWAPECATSQIGSARRGREVHAVLAVDRRHPVAADEVLIPRLALHRAAGLPGRLEGGGLLNCCHCLGLQSFFVAACRRSLTYTHEPRSGPRLAHQGLPSTPTCISTYSNSHTPRPALPDAGEPLIEPGKACDVILKAANSTNADMIVMGSRRLDGLRALGARSLTAGSSAAIPPCCGRSPNPRWRSRRGGVRR